MNNEKILNDWMIQSVSNQNQIDKLNQVFDFILKEFSELNVEIKWNVPMFMYKKTFIIGFSVHKNHISVSPEKTTINNFKKEIISCGYECLNNLFKIQNNQVIDLELIKKIINKNILEKQNCNHFFRKG